MKLLKEMHKKESGQALILAVILLLLGSLIIAPLLGFMSTGLLAGLVFEERMDKVYAADAGIEDAMHKIVTGDASVAGLAEGETLPTYQLTDVNGYPVDVTITKLYLVEGLLGEDEYPNGATPHVDNIELEVFEALKTYGTDANGDFVKYPCEITFEYTGPGSRQIQSIGTFFSPLPNNDGDLVGDPDEIVYTLEMTDDDLESIQTRIVSGGFAFIWRWQENPPRGPIFNSGDTGTISFTFKIYEPTWEYKLSFIWAIVKQDDIAYICNANFSKWLIEATAGDTIVQSAIVEEIGRVDILTWEINPPA